MNTNTNFHRPTLARPVLATLALLGVISGVATAALAGVVIVVETETLDGSAPTGTAVVYVEPGKLRIDSTEGGGDATIIYTIGDDGEPKFSVIDRRENTIVHISRAEMDMMKERIEEARKTFDAQVESLPPEERERMEKAFEREIGRLARRPVPIRYRKVSSGAKVAGWKCTHYEGYREDEKSEEVWAANIDEIGLGEAEIQMFRELASLFEGVGQDMPAFFEFARARGEAGDVRGFPVMVVEYADGKRKEKSEVKSIRKEDFEEGFFDVPKGAKAKPMNEPRR